MFRYMLGPIDYFIGCISIAQYLDQIKQETTDSGYEREASAVITKLSCEMGKLYGSGWEGDVREGIYVFAVPGEEVNTVIGFIFKQDNNGTTFVLSPVELPHLSEFIVA